MSRRHVVVALLLTFFVVVGGILLLIARFHGTDSGLDTDTPNGGDAVSYTSLL